MLAFGNIRRIHNLVSQIISLLDNVSNMIKAFKILQNDETDKEAKSDESQSNYEKL